MKRSERDESDTDKCWGNLEWVVLHSSIEEAVPLHPGLIIQKRIIGSI